MDLTIKSFVLFGSVVLSGLSAGLFYAWSVSVIPGTLQVNDSTYLQSMQSINRAILNGRFFLIFFGSLVFLVIATVYQFQERDLTFWLLLCASIAYLLGTIGVTGMGNVPLNNQLDALELTKLNANKLTEFRAFYETSWNRFHQLRTIFAAVAFVLSVLAVFAYSKY